MGQAVYLSAKATSDLLTTPVAGFGALAYQGGSVYWYWNASDNTWHAVDLAASGGSVVPGGNNEDVQWKDSTGAFAGSDNFIYDKNGQAITVTALNDTSPGVIVKLGSVQADAGFYTSSTSNTAVNVLSGGVTAQHIIANQDIIHLGLVTSGAPVGSANQGKLYYDVTLHAWMVLQGTNAAVRMIGGGVAGPDKSVQYNSNGVMGGDTGLTYDYTPGTQLLTANNITATGRILSNNTYSIAATTVPMAPSSGFAKWYFDSAAGVMKISYYPTAAGSATAYIPWGVAGGANEHVQFKDSDGSFAGSANFIYDKNGQAVTITALNATSAGLIVKTGSVQADAGFYTSSTSNTAVNVLTGGVTANHIIANQDFIHLGLVTAGAPVGSTNQGKLYYDVTLHSWMVLQGTDPAVRMLGGGVFGPDQAIQYNNNGVMAGGSGLTYNYTNGRLNVYPSGSPDLGSGQDPYLKFHAVGSNGAIAIFIDAYDTSGGSFPFALPGVIGRRALGAIGGSFSNLASGTPLFAMGGRGSTTSGFTTANASVISFQTSEAWTTSANGAEIVFATTKNLGTSRTNWMFLRNNGVLEVIGTSGLGGVLLDNGYFQSQDAGFFANGAFVSVFNAPNGGASLGLAIYLSARSSAPSNPLGGYGGIGYNGGSTYWYWNGSGWATVNFASVGGGGGITSINGQTGPAITIVQGTGVAITTTSNQVLVGIGQAVATTSSVTFASVSATNTLSSTNGLIINGLQVANSSGIWSNSVQTTGHVFGGDFGIQGVFVGGTADIVIGGVGTLHFQGGIFKNMT
jgi:hypothetical protein